MLQNSRDNGPRIGVTANVPAHRFNQNLELNCKLSRS